MEFSILRREGLNHEQGPGLFHFISLTGEPGRQWIADFKATELLQLTKWSEQAVALLRRRQSEAALDLFSRIERGLPAVNGVPPAGRQLFDRFYYGARAYLSYCREDWEGAHGDLQRAHDAVAASVSRVGFLLPLAQHAAELRLQRARISRNQNRWEEMRQHVQAVRGMMEDRAPLCELADGTPVFFSTLAEFYNAIPSLLDAERESLRNMLEPRQRLANFEMYVRWLYALPGFTILYP